MDKSRKIRGPQRTCLTKLIAELEEEIVKDVVDQNFLRTKTKRLEETMDDILKLDEKVLDRMLEADSTEEELEQELAVVNEYKERVISVIFKVHEKVNPVLRPGSPTHSQFGTAVSNNDGNRRYKLPKIELKKFDGELTEWLGFWAQFEKIHEDENLHASDKFQYLVQVMQKGTRARELVESYPQTAENYPKAIQALKERFGKTELLVEVYARDLHRLVVSNASSTDKIKLSTLYDKLESRLRALESLCTTAETNAVLLFTLVESCLPVETLRAWNRDTLSTKDGSHENPPKSRMDFLLEFLRKEIQSEERIALSRPQSEKKEKHNQKNVSKPTFNKSSSEGFPTAAGLHVGSESCCIFCEKSHYSEKCSKTPEMSLEEKQALVRKKNCCYVCLRMGHQSKTCKSFVKCILCNGKHKNVMCPKLTAVRKENHAESKSAEVKTTQSNLSCSSGVILKTLIVKIVSPNNEMRKVRVLIDDGSQRTYIRKKLAEELGLRLTGEEKIIHSLFGGVKTDVKHHNKYLMRLKNNCQRNTFIDMQALDQENICGDIQRLTAGSWMEQLKENKIWLSDIGSEPLQIDILLGADTCGKLLTGRTLQLKNGLTAIETVLGWTVMGDLQEKYENKSVAMLVSSMFVSSLSVEQLWSLEAIGISDPAESKSKEEKEKPTKEHFLKTVSRSKDGRYIISLPWISEKTNIPDNKAVALKRLEYTTKKLKTEKKLDLYENVFNGWLNEGIIEEVPEKELNDIAYYLPHRAVFKEESTTTPVRPVFDASCKNGRAPSLNECLEKGPNLLEEIPAILLRFREGRVGAISDIRKAFLMIEVAEEDRNFLRFLWWKDAEQKEFKVFRHKRVVFGVNCSPFLLGAVIQHHLRNVSEEKREIAEKLQKSLYVDNCVTSLGSMEDYIQFKSEATDIMASAGMDLRLWESSSAEVPGIGSLSSSECGLGTGRNEIDNTQQSTAVLGLKWDKVSDSLFCDTSFINATSIECVTKRAILSAVQKIYDPIGFLCPVLLLPKKLLQETWAKKTSWDEPLTQPLISRFEDWFHSLNLLKNILIPRNVTGGNNDRSTWQLHTFCDASKDAYASVVFLRTEKEGKISVQLLQAKSRIAPLKLTNAAEPKTSTIPRLELLGCTIGSRLTKSVKEALDLENIPEFFWSDSTTALAWIKRNDEWGTFVGNRVKEICTLTRAENWNHVPGILNPADLPSRGCGPNQLLTSRWWEGPSWLKLNREEWPHCSVTEDEEEIAKEKKKSVAVGLLVADSYSPWYVKLSSSYWKILRIVSWMRRFIDNARKNLPSRNLQQELSVEEIESTEMILVKLVQTETFSTKDEVIAGIHVQRDEMEIIRVKTKLQNREDTVGFCFPMLLPNNHPMVDLLIRETHLRNRHTGTQFLMSKIREKFWILQGRRAIRKIVSRCVTCRRYSCKKSYVVPAALPENRVKNSTAFQVTGVDIAGPLILKSKEKVWIALFTCAVYRCVHLELVRSLSTEEFLEAFSRFMDRRGRPRVVYSDNGTNFVGASNLFQSIDWKKVEKESTILRIQWIFNPPSAAWWGGFWERLIRTVKDLLRRILGKSSVNFEKLETYLCNIEAYINGRPLTTVTEDVDDLTPLTPAMFLQELPTPDVSELDYINCKMLQKQLKTRKTLLDEFKGRFRREYLSQLVQRGKIMKVRKFSIGEVVLVGDDNKKRWQWPLARIMELYPGKDGQVRVAKVRTAHGSIVRPFQRLFPLEVSSDDDFSKAVPKATNGNSSKGDALGVKENLHIQEQNGGRKVPEKLQEIRMVETRSGRISKIPNRYV